MAKALSPLEPLGLSPEEADLSAAAIDAFTTALGGRQRLTEALLVADGTPEVEQVLSLLLDPSYQGWTLRRLCTRAGLTIVDLFAAYKSALIVKAHLQATQVVTDHLVEVVADVMRRSQPHEVTCEDCGGVGQTTSEPTKKIPNPSPAPCDACRGTGRLLRQPDLDRQKVALELGQLLTKSGGISMTQQTLIAPPAAGRAGAAFGPGALVALQQAVGEILTPRPRRAPTPQEPEPILEGIVAAVQETSPDA